MSEKIISFNDKKKGKSNFYENKKINRVGDIDVNKILVSKKRTIRNKKFIKILYWI